MLTTLFHQIQSYPQQPPPNHYFMGPETSKLVDRFYNKIFKIKIIVKEKETIKKLFAERPFHCPLDIEFIRKLLKPIASYSVFNWDNFKKSTTWIDFKAIHAFYLRNEKYKIKMFKIFYINVLIYMRILTLLGLDKKRVPTFSNSCKK